MNTLADTHTQYTHTHTLLASDNKAVRHTNAVRFIIVVGGVLFEVLHSLFDFFDFTFAK